MLKTMANALSTVIYDNLLDYNNGVDYSLWSEEPCSLYMVIIGNAGQMNVGGPC